MRRSEFDRAVTDEFGARAPALVDDLVLTAFGATAAAALDAGADVRDIWSALCEQMDVPATRRTGAGRIDPAISAH